MKKRVVAVDFDDVVVETGPLIVKHYNETYGTKVPLTALYSQDMSLWCADSLQTVLRRIDAFQVSEDYFAQTRLLPDPNILRSLTRTHELHIVTGRPQHMQPATVRTIQLHAPGVFSGVHYTGIFEKNPRTKSDVCLAIGADLLIDDHIAHAHDVTRFGIDVLCLVTIHGISTTTSLPVPAECVTGTKWPSTSKPQKSQPSALRSFRPTGAAVVCGVLFGGVVLLPFRGLRTNLATATAYGLQPPMVL